MVSSQAVFATMIAMVIEVPFASFTSGSTASQFFIAVFALQ
jgi:hypothetical protein